MSNPFWKTTAPGTRPGPTTWPSLLQLLFQLGIAGLIVVVWIGVYYGYSNITQAQAVNPPTPEPVAAATSPSSPTPPAVSEAAMLAPTATTIQTTPTSETTPPLADLEATATISTVQESDNITSTATLTATQVAPTLAISPTETPVAPPATDTPVSEETEADAPSEEAVPDENGSSEVSFANDILPIFEQRCFKCHGDEDIEEGLDLRTYDDILAGSRNGSVVEPGNVEDSYLIEQIVSGEMPKRAPSLLPAEIRAITAWIEAGAPNN